MTVVKACFRKCSTKCVAAIACIFFLLIISQIHTRNLSRKLLELENRLAHLDSSSREKDSISRQISITSFQSAPGTISVHKKEEVENNYANEQQNINHDVLSLNNTRLADTQVLFFNRVPKVGSVMFLELIRLLAIRNNFSTFESQQTNPVRLALTKGEQEDLAMNISQLVGPAVFQGHIGFLNFSEFNLPKPIYINLVRDPVERVISWFYYIRAPWYFIGRNKRNPEIPLPKPGWLRKDFETCVLTGDKECNYVQDSIKEKDFMRMTQFFCGFHEECLPFNSQSSLEEAKRNVESQFSVVGVIEDLNTTLAVLEKYIPRFFAGARELYFQNTEAFKKVNKNNFKIDVSEEVKNIVRQNFTREIKFYEFCKKRLQAQLLAVTTEDL